jgi:hypothetical protein
MSDPTPRYPGTEANPVAHPDAAAVAEQKPLVDYQRPAPPVADDYRAQLDYQRRVFEHELAKARAELAAAQGALDEARAPAVEGELPPIVLPELHEGDTVTVSYRDPLDGRGVDVVELARVIQVVDLEPDARTGTGGGPAAIVAYLERVGVSHPIPLDHRHHNRIDAPRVARVG